MWHYNSKGVFTVRSAYHLAMEHRRRELNSSRGENSTPWAGDSMMKLIWKQSLPSKIKHFAWKACTNTLPMKSNLLKRKVLVTTLCEVCGSSDESALHALKDRVRVSQVWNYTLIDHCFLNSSPRDVRDWFSEYRFQVGEEKMVMVLTVMWAIWHSCNLVVFKGVRKDPQSTAHTTLKYLDEYVAAQSGGRKGVSAVGARWPSPMLGRFKVNADGALFAEASSVGFGVVVRNHKGHVIAVASKKLTGLFASAHVEAMALEFATDLGLTAVDFEGDNLEVMAALQSDSVPYTAMGLILDDVLVETTASFVSCHFMHIGRKGNEVAHGLAKYAKFVEDVIVWMEKTPSCVRDQVDCDLSHLIA